MLFYDEDGEDINHVTISISQALNDNACLSLIHRNHKNAETWILWSKGTLSILRRQLKKTTHSSRQL